MLAANVTYSALTNILQFVDAAWSEVLCLYLSRRRPSWTEEKQWLLRSSKRARSGLVGGRSESPLLSTMCSLVYG